MKNVFLIANALVLSALILTSCNSSSKKVENAEKEVIQANKDLEEANKELEQDMADYRKEIALKIESNNQSIIELKNKINDQKKEARIEYKQKIADLEAKNNDLRIKMDNYRANNKDQWESFKKEFNHDMEALGEAFQDITIKNTK